MSGCPLTGSCWACNADVGVNKSLAAGRDDSGLGGVDVVASCESTAARGEAGFFRKLLDQKRNSHGVVSNGCFGAGAYGKVAGDFDAFGGRGICSVAGVIDSRLGGHVPFELNDGLCT